MKRRNAPGTSRNPAEVLEQRSLLTTFTVNSLADTPDATPGDGLALDANGEVSLRAALEEANAFAGADVIEFNDGSGPGVNFHDATPDTITLGGTQLQVSSQLDLMGPGANLLTVSGNNASRVFQVTSTADALLDSITIAKGSNASNGPGIANSGTLTLANSTVKQNTATAIRHTGSKTLTILNSTVTNNIQDGIQSLGDVVIVNSTVSKNNGNGIRLSGGADVTVINSTVSQNTGIGIHNAGNRDLSIVNSIVAGNSGTEVLGAVNVSQNNIIQNNASAVIAPLGNNGGPTKTHALLPGSTAINAGNDVLAVDGNGLALSNDQRGVGFQRIVGASVDIGSVEFTEADSLVVTTNLDTTDPTDGLTSLREALAFANSNPDFSEITFGDGTSLTGGTDFTDTTPDTITLGGSALQVTSELTIFGSGADLLTVSGNGASRVFSVSAGADAVLDSLLISDGQSNNGGGIISAGTLTISNSTVSRNNARGIQNTGSGMLTVINSTVTDNFQDGIRNFGDLVVVNSTVSDNAGNGIRHSGSSGNLAITNSTIASNNGFGINNIDNATLNIANSIIAGNSNTEVLGAIAVNQNNIIQNNANSIIGPLQDNGGPTLTRALRPGSAAINAGSNALAVDGDGNGLANDQRGTGFDRTIGGTVDIGAFEYSEAASLVVTTSSDVSDPTDDLTSLREALAFANSDPDYSEVTFGDGSSLTNGTDFTDALPDTITLSGTDLDLSSEILLNGPGADLLLIDPNGSSRAFNVVGTSVVSISDLSVTNGNASGSTGGALKVGGNATARVFQVEFYDNIALTGGAGGGAIDNRGTLVVINSTLANNRAGTGGAIFNDGNLQIINSTLSGNHAALGAFGNGGGFRTVGGQVSVTNSTIVNNVSRNVGAGIQVVGGSVTLNNSIVSGNTMTNGGTSNIWGGFLGSNNIVGGNVATILTSLTDNGGSTRTHALLPGSNAIDGGDNALAVDENGDALVADQRGENRFFGTVDIGAFEAQNQAPTADAGGPYAVAEGSDVSLDGAGSSDPDNDTLTYEWDFNYDGSTFDVDAAGETPDFNGIDDGDVTVALRVSDGTELSDIVTTTVTVTNADPAISGLTTDSATLASKSDDGVVTLSGSVTDAGTLDTHQVVVDWGDGNVETIVAAGDLVASPDFSGTQHTYAAGGIYTITVTVTDDDGGIVTETTSAVVQGVGVVDGVLYVIGTNGDDVVKMREKNHGTQLRVKTKFDGGSTTTQYFDIADINSIEMHLCDGDDYASLTHAHWWHKHSVDIPATINGGDGDDVLIGGSLADVIDGGNGDDCLHGESGDDTIHGGDGHDWIDGGWGDDIVYAGAGNDWVWGGFGNDILLGQSGNDRLFGGWGRDIIIAGEGADYLFGQGQDDILITGDTNRDDDEDALKAMRDLWTGNGSASSRAQSIQDAGLEVFHDDDVDKAWGGWGLDWMLFDSDLDRVYC